jgi:hypothetical protein
VAVSAPLPQPDAEYIRAFHAADRTRFKALLDAYRPYVAEPDLYRARMLLNEAGAEIEAAFAASLNEARQSLRARLEQQDTCDGCHEVMRAFRPDQRYHPACEPSSGEPSHADPDMPDDLASQSEPGEDW